MIQVFSHVKFDLDLTKNKTCSRSTKHLSSNITNIRRCLSWPIMLFRPMWPISSLNEYKF